MIQTLEPILKEHPFFQGIEIKDFHLIVGCAKNLQYEKGFLFREQETAETFYLLREGQINLEVSSKTGSLIIETLGAGDAVGWSWLFPPYKWHFDARIVKPIRAIALDGKCLRQKCTMDPSFGFTLMQRITSLVVLRLQATRLRLIEEYEEANSRRK